MKILLVNNHSKHLSELLNKLKDVKVVDFKKLDLINYKKFDLIILSGGSSFSVKNHKEEYKKEIDLIKNSSRPILGICLGFELIAYSFNEKLEKMAKKKKGSEKIKIISEDQILKGLKKEFEVFEAHRWAVSKTKYLIPLAKSKNGIEIIRHPTKRIWGVQFHPEISKEKGYVGKIINNFIKVALN
ncbi:gamma-glutamyl-gamma-aminobutyrate hydrolase family protein [Candidatus Pacearchaeota archaeon]|nr:gamma-glutamyl-gamma-aminobutyrate hydrolase family protein [Candidatus Pacearchaeota archaeon]